LHYKILIPKIEITDREALWNKANDLVARWAPPYQSDWYWAYRDDEIVYGFESSDVASWFIAYCINERIRYRREWPS
jgi:hypothetical protein